jgi:sialic acid synthase SpsE
MDLILDFCNNHCGNEDILLQMFDLAFKNKVRYVKFQLYNPEKLNPEYPDYQRYKKYLEKHKINEYMLNLIKSTCENYGMTPIFTIFTQDQLGRLKEFANYILKIASPDMTNHNLINACLKNKKKVIISTGMHNKKEIETVRTKYKNKCEFMYCISRYPTEEWDIDYTYMASFDGFSDHTLGILAAKKAFLKGINYVEKHFTLSRYLPGKDHYMSMTCDELEEISNWIEYKRSIETYKNRWVI